MPSLRIASINGEWMNNWFTSDGLPAGFLPSFRRPGKTPGTPAHPTATTAQRLANEIIAINPDILAIQEAPSRKADHARQELQRHDASLRSACALVRQYLEAR